MEQSIEERLDIISKISENPERHRKICEELTKLPPRESEWCINPKFTSEITGRSITNTVRAIAATFVIQGASAQNGIKMAKLVIDYYDRFFKGMDTLG